jgi:hypothetical protein
MYSATLAFKAISKHCITVFRGNLITHSHHLFFITPVTIISSLDSYSFSKVSATMSIYCNNEKESNHIPRKKQELLQMYLIREE